MQVDPKLVRLVLVDDHTIVRRGMRSFLESFPDLVVVGEAANAEEALEKLTFWQPDVVIMDLLLPGGMDGFEAIRRINTQANPPRVVALTAYTDEARAIAALRAGAISYVRKDAQPEFLLEVVRAAARGKSMLDESITNALLHEAEPAPMALSAREMEVAVLVARGLSNRQIAQELVLSEETVKSHVGNVLAKLGLTQRSQVTIYALRQGWVKLEEIG